MSIIRRRGYARTIFIPGINQDVAPRGFYRQGHYASIVMYACKKATVGNRDPGNTCPTFPLLFSPPPPIQQSGSSLRRSLPKERDSSSSVIAPTPFPSLYERRPRWHGTRIRRGCILTPSSSFRAPASAFSFPRVFVPRATRSYFRHFPSGKYALWYNSWYTRDRWYARWRLSPILSKPAARLRSLCRNESD